MNPSMRFALDDQAREVTLEHAARSASQRLYCPYCGVQVLFIPAEDTRTARFSPIAGLRHKSNRPNASQAEGLFPERTYEPDWREWRLEQQREIDKEHRREEKEEAHQRDLESESQRQDQISNEAKEKKRSKERDKDYGLEM